MRILILFVFIICGCQTPTKKDSLKTTVSDVAYLKFYDSEINLENKSQKFIEGRSQVTTQFFANAQNKELIKKKENFKNSFLKNQNCLVDSAGADRVLFYYGGAELHSLTAQSAGEACIKAEAESFKAQFGETTISKKLAKLECTEKIGAISKKLQIDPCD